MEPFSYPQPQMPAHVRAKNEELTLLNRALVQALLGRSTAAMREAEELRRLVAARVARPVTEAEKTAEDHYYLHVRKYNEAVVAYNTRLDAERQTRINARETAKIRNASCPNCFATHPGEC